MSKLTSLTSAAMIAGALFAGSTLGAKAEGYAEGDAANGEKVFRRCQSCHMVGEGASNKVGPWLNGIVGRKVAMVEDYKYGDDLKKLGEGDMVWTEEELFAYLEDPRKYLREKLDDKKARSKMAFKLKKEDDRNDVIAYLKTFETPTN